MLGDDLRIPGLAAGQRVQAVGAARGRQVFAGDEAAQGAVGRQDAVVDHPPVLGGQALAVFVAEALRHRPHRAPEQAFLGAAGGQYRIELGQYRFDQRARRHHPGGDAGAHVVDGLVEQRRDAERAPRPVLVVTHALEGLCAGAGAEQGDQRGRAVVGTDGHHPAGLVAPGQRGADVAHEQLVGQQVLAAQAGIADRLDPGQPLLVELVVLLAEGQRQRVGQLVVVARVALQRGLQRVELHQCIPVLGVEPVEPGRVVHRSGRGAAAATLGLGGRTGQHEQGGGHGQGQGTEQDNGHSHTTIRTGLPEIARL